MSFLLRYRTRRAYGHAPHSRNDGQYGPKGHCNQEIPEQVYRQSRW